MFFVEVIKGSFGDITDFCEREIFVLVEKHLCLDHMLIYR